MPQMSPLMWLSLFIMFSIMLISFNFINYFSFMYKSQIMNQKTTLTKSINWKW